MGPENGKHVVVGGSRSTDEVATEVAAYVTAKEWVDRVDFRMAVETAQARQANEHIPQTPIP